MIAMTCSYMRDNIRADQFVPSAEVPGRDRKTRTDGRGSSKLIFRETYCPRCAPRLRFLSIIQRTYNRKTGNKPERTSSAIRRRPHKHQPQNDPFSLRLLSFPFSGRNFFGFSTLFRLFLGGIRSALPKDEFSARVQQTAGKHK